MLFLEKRELPQVHAAQLLEQAQAEVRHDRQQMVEYVGLNGLIFRPGGGAGEAVDFDRQPARGGLELADQQRHVLPDAGMMLQIGLNIGAKRAKVGEFTPVDRVLAALLQPRVPSFAVGLFGVEIGAKHGEAPERRFILQIGRSSCRESVWQYGYI